MAEQTAKRPRVIGLVGLLIIGGLLGLLGSLGLIGIISSGLSDIPGWVTATAYLSLVLSVGGLVTAVLIALYRRVGLMLGLGIFGLSVISTVLQLLSGQVSLGLSTIITLVIAFAALYYCYIYLTREPEKTFFK